MTDDEGLRVVGHLLDRHATTGKYARDIRGVGIAYMAPGATCWCLMGAIYAVACRVMWRSRTDEAFRAGPQASSIRMAKRAADMLGVVPGGAIPREHRWVDALVPGDLEMHWDEAGKERRREIVEALKAAGVKGGS